MAARHGISRTKGPGVMRIFIEPTEPLLFRTGRSFDAGESNFAESIFPPTPETIQGALRAMIAVQWGKAQPNLIGNLEEIFKQPSIVDLIGKGNIYGQFRITGFTLGRRRADKKVERLFPAPFHIIQATIQTDYGTKIKRVRLKPRALAGQLSNVPEGKRLLFLDLNEEKTAKKSEPLNGWLTAQGLWRALRNTGDLADIQAVPASTIYERESRLGIGMNNSTKTIQEGYLYQTQMIRMQPNYGFVIDVELGKDVKGGGKELPYGENLLSPQETRDKLNFLKRGWLTLGGEQRAAYFEVLESDHIAEEPGIGQTQQGSLIYFATPTYFKGGWLPEASNILPTTPITAAISRYQSIGGWQLEPGHAGGSSKTTRRCVPAGSVYICDKPVSVTQQ